MADESNANDGLDAAAIAACAAGDAAAMGALFDRHQQSVYRFLSRLGVSSNEIDDVVHSTFLQAFRSARRFRGGSQVRTWLFGIAVNVHRHHRRGEARRRAFLTLWAREIPTIGKTAVRPDHAAESQQLSSRISAALAALPSHLRAAFVTCDVEGLSGAEAALALNVHPGTLGRRLHEARKALRAALEKGFA